MAKVGKSRPAYDPFNPGNQALPDLSKALDQLDQEKPAPKSPAAPKPKDERPRQKEVTTSRRQKTATATNQAARTAPKKPTAKPSGGGGDEAAPRQRVTSAKTTKRFLTTREEASRFDKAAMRLGAELGISLDFSKLTRALWECYLRHETDIVRNVPEGEEWYRPANADRVGLAELDEQLTELVNEGLLIAGRRLRKPKG